MTRTEARAIARHLCSPVIRVASGRGGITYGFHCAIQPNAYTTAGRGDYRTAQRARSEWIADMERQLMDGTAPDWAGLGFQW